MKKGLIFYPLILLGILSFYLYGRSVWYPVALKFMEKRTVDDVINVYGEVTREEMALLFVDSGVAYPPDNMALIAFKDTRVLELWAANDGDNYQLIKSYPIKAASGELGPKLMEGDRQVPEGIYKIVGFNPNSAYHLSMKLNYPNSYDLSHAKSEGRDQPGSNIFIHGRAVSVGCLAMGDTAIEQLFSLVHATGKANTTVLISPTDPSKNELVVPAKAPAWTDNLYRRIKVSYGTINAKYNGASN